MGISTFEGIVAGGAIRLPRNVSLPERTKVYIIVPDAEPVPPARICSPRLVHREQARDFAKEVIGDAGNAKL